MSQPTKTKTCGNCGADLEEATRGRPKLYCSDACKQSAYRTRHTKAPTLERLLTSQRRHDRPEARRQRHGGEQDSSIIDRAWSDGQGSDLVITEDNGTTTVLGSAYGKTRRGRIVARLDGASPFPPVAEEAIWRSSDPYGGVRWDEVYHEAIREFLLALYPRFRQPWEPRFSSVWHRRPSRLDREIAVERWFFKYLMHPDLTLEGRLEVITRIPEDYLRARAARDFERQKEKKMELATVAAQNEQILAKIEQLRETQTEILGRLTETVERVRERFPDDAEVSAAVDRFLDDI